MNTFFSLQDGSILLRLLAAHMLTDFFLQPGKWVSSKNLSGWASPYLWLHGLLTAAIAWLALGDLKWWWVAAAIFLIHTITDGIKITISKTIDKTNQTATAKTTSHTRLFVADQLAHIITLVVLWLIMIEGFPKMLDLLQSTRINYHLLLIVTGYLIVLQPVGYYIQHVTRRWWTELEMQDSLKDAGKWIGMLERVLILTFVLTSQFASIGFLIAAKSILRLIDKPNQSPLNQENKPFSARKHTEYVLIGTFLSFSISLAIGLLINYFLRF
ncbi:MAG: DUF3307 domain-containing protein [Gemmatimonadaceae bacterium]|nr:DUF3307 domain-containing protein [Chitinophagaceae bacterium]